MMHLNSLLQTLKKSQKLNSNPGRYGQGMIEEADFLQDDWRLLDKINQYTDLKYKCMFGASES